MAEPPIPTSPPGGSPPPDASAPGGSLRQYADFLLARSQAAIGPPDQASGWFPGVSHELQRLPITCTTPPDAHELQRVLSNKGVWVASYMLDPAPDRPANCFNYLCTDDEYDIEKLSKPARRDIRRGLRCFAIRPISWDELLRFGLPAYADTESRHGHATPKLEELEELAKNFRGCSCVELWGAWDQAGLAAWIRVLKVDNWAVIISACSRHDALRDCPNNALVYQATCRFLLDEKRRWVSYGISSVQATDNIVSLHKFKLRMGYTAVPQCRTFAVSPALRPFVESRAAAWVWAKAAAVRPRSATLSKVAGMAHLLAKVDPNPLAWADEPDWQPKGPAGPRRMKRLLDILASALALLLLSPLLLAIALLVRLTSPGPVLFRQTRVGLGGRDFSLLKFRTMTVRPDASGGSFDAGDTSRVTRAGRLLRATKLDELPQFWNVLVGQMSLVGPRPEVRTWVEAYPARWARVHTVPPGITDPASIAYRNEEEILAASDDPREAYRQEILPRKLDLYEQYVDHHSLCGDLGILLRTAMAVLFSRAGGPAEGAGPAPHEPAAPGEPAASQPGEPSGPRPEATERIPFRIVPIEARHLDGIVDVHMRAFPKFFLTFLGPRFLKEFYASFLVDDAGVGFVAEEEESGLVLGAVVGPLVPSGYFKRLLKRRWWAFCLASSRAVLRKPRTIKRLLRAILYRGDSPPGPPRSLLSSVAVSPDRQGHGIGRKLVDAWVNEVRRRGSTGCFLSTNRYHNEAVNRFYQAIGWKLESSYATAEGRIMNRYVLDFEPGKS